MQLQAITGWSSFPLIPKTMDHFWKHRLHLYSHIRPWANTCMHSFIQLTAQKSWEHFSVQGMTHRNPIWDVQHSADQCMLWGSLYAQPTEAGDSKTTQGDLAPQSQHQELMFWTAEVPSVSLKMTGIACIYCIMIFCRIEFPSRGKVDITLKTASKTSNELHTGD